MNASKLNVGSGVTYIPGFTNIDISSRADVVLDLGRERLPFDSDSVDLVFSYHCLEHVEGYLFCLGEIHRVLKHGGLFLVGLPYATLTEYHLVNPYHLHNFNEWSFDFFSPERLKGSAAEENQILFRKVFHDFHYMGMFKYLPGPLRRWSRRHLLNVVKKIDFGLVAIKDVDDVPSVTTAVAKEARRTFRECLRARVRYDAGKRIGVERASKTKRIVRAVRRGLARKRA